MSPSFFEKPILNSPYAYPARHWELDADGQPTNRIIEARRLAEFITPIPRSKKRKSNASQQEIVFDEAKVVSTDRQRYEKTAAMINTVRLHVDKWRMLPDASDWKVTPETARLLQHWRHYKFNDARPFFCQIEAAETAIWLSEVAPTLGKSAAEILEYLDAASENANPGVSRLALKLATGA
ncbi:MAG TPA: hypothetical protein VLJ39_16765, partial [Tepidisphaeraceae bacterium]|nr:hypothetical protein [Tepidisphaeraceae bacterium]